MKKNIISIIFLIFSFFCATAQDIKSPDEFLGYQLGSKYTPHHKVVAYFKYVEAASTQMMRLDEYGTTTEDRPLFLACISSSQNFARLDEIRKNNLRLTGLLKDKPADINTPTIVWLSYNVHGNEPSSSEAAMKTLYELLNGKNAKVQSYLKNTVVLIDPCLNPDGRDRYVSWFNQMVGKNPNAALIAREHSEPWPTGRTNHYNFDLNRDWAWQTQIETQQRIKEYNKWLPQIHCDFHENGHKNSYYFPPAAEPFHDAVTAWQRDFQDSVGRNYAKYFDANNWLYYTKEVYDLFYPSYGDTYPMFNGAIGMTFEQAGLGAAGLAVVKSNGDLLTLTERIEHHFTTSISTIETASQNADRLVKEFKKFYDNAQNNGTSEYQTYIATTDNLSKLNALKEFLQSNQIQFGSLKKTPAKGYNYFSGKEEAIVTEMNTIAINANQPKGTLLKVLFEPSSKLVDSVTYDITAWSLPYVYGIKAYAVKERGLVDNAMASSIASVEKSNFGYLVDYNSIAGTKLLASLLNEGFKVRCSEKDITFKKKVYKKGTLIVLKNGNEIKFEKLIDLFSKYNVPVVAIGTGYVDTGVNFGSLNVHQIKKPTVVLLTGNGVVPEAAGEVWHFFEQELNYPITLINADELNTSMLKNADVLILPSGNYKWITDFTLSEEIKNWVKQGGKIIALENAVTQMAANEWGIKQKKSEETKVDAGSYADIKRYENREREDISKNIPGAIYKVELDNTHPLAFGYPEYYFTLKQNTNVFEFSKEGWNVGVMKKDKQVAGFVGSKVAAGLVDGTVIGVQQSGNGAIVYFADDPIFRSFWENGKLLFANAVFFVGQ